jgi:hypothetical protein
LGGVVEFKLILPDQGELLAFPKQQQSFMCSRLDKELPAFAAGEVE